MTTHFVRSPLVRTNGVLYGDNSTLIHLCDVKFLLSIPHRHGARVSLGTKPWNQLKNGWLVLVAHHITNPCLTCSFLAWQIPYHLLPAQGFGTEAKTRVGIPEAPAWLGKIGQYLDFLQPSTLLLTKHARGYGQPFFAPHGMFFVILYVMFWVTVDIWDYSVAIFNQRRLYYWIAVKFVTRLRKRVDRFFP